MLGAGIPQTLLAFQALAGQWVLLAVCPTVLPRAISETLLIVTPLPLLRSTKDFYVKDLSTF